MPKLIWSEAETKCLYDLKKQGLTWANISKKMGKSWKSCKSKYSTTNWDIFFKKERPTGNFWTPEQLYQLYILNSEKKLTQRQMAKQIGKTINAVTHTLRKTNWPKFLSEYKQVPKKSAITKEIVDQSLIDNLITAIIELSRHDPDQLKTINKEQFFSKIIIDSKNIPITFTELKKKALYQLEQIGGSYPSSQIFGEGTYIIVGDTHGKHTRTGMFKLIKNLNDYLQADKIIHIGHILDDDETINYNWKDFKNFCVIAKEEELKFLAQAKLPYPIIKKEIILGEKLTVTNQDLITDYVQTPISQSITPEFFNNSTICNLHRHEFSTRCTEEDATSIIASPGCLCENHIVYTVRQQDFTNGRTIRLTFPTGYKKYRRMEHMYKTWQQGVLVVHVNKNGDFTIIQCRILKTSQGFTTSYFDKIITETEILDPDEKTLIISDLHSPLHDTKVLDIVDQIVKDYKPNNSINLGDMSGNKSINHHEFKKHGTMGSIEDILEESAANNYLISKMKKWAPHKILLLGNHERFYQDFVDKFPQFTSMFDFKFLNGIGDLEMEIIDLKNMKKIGNANYIHGDLIMIGQTGSSKLDKVFRTYGKNTVFGHSHYAATRKDCHTIGLLGKKDLEYNETNASRWINSIGLANTFEDECFIANVCIVDNKCLINKKIYMPQNPSNWNVPYFQAKIQYTFPQENINE